MFSSNQILKINGKLESLENTMNFALELSGHAGCKNMCYQITEDGAYCIGWFSGEEKEGWKKYPFDFDTHIVSEIIMQYLAKSPVEEKYGDGSYKKGFLMESITECDNSEKGCKNPFFGIVSFKPHTIYFAK